MLSVHVAPHIDKRRITCVNAQFVHISVCVEDNLDLCVMSDDN